MEHDCNDTNLEDPVVQNLDTMPPVLQLSQKISKKRVNEEWSLSENDSPKKSRRESFEVNSSRASSRTSCSTTTSENENVITATTTTTNTDYENVTTATSTNIDLDNISRCEPQDELSSVYHNTNTTAQPNKTSFKKFHYQGCFYNAIAKEMQAMKNDNYLDIIIFCKDNVSMRANSFLAGLAFVELRGIGELVGRDLIIPDISVDELNKLFENVLEFLGKVEVEESDVLPDTTAAEQADKMINTLQDVASNIDSVLLAVSNGSRFVAYEDPKTGGFKGYLPTKESNRVEITVPDIDEKEINQSDVERNDKPRLGFSQSTEDNNIADEPVTPKKKGTLRKHYPHSRPTCKNCPKSITGLMDYYHHPCNGESTRKANTCIICNITMDERKFRCHLNSALDCKRTLIKKFYKERNLEPPHLIVDKRKLKRAFSKVKKKQCSGQYLKCNKCGSVFQGKTQLVHHKCYWSDKSRCRFCKEKFEDISKRFSHFKQNVDCMSSLKKLDISKLIVCQQPKKATKRPNVSSRESMLASLSSPSTKDNNPIRGGRSFVCQLCHRNYPGRISFTHHECYCKDATKCKYCNKPYKDEKKGNHIANTKACREKMKGEMEYLFPDSLLLLPSNRPLNCIIPKSKDLGCEECGAKFFGYISFYQHKCKFDGPRTKCRFCGQIFEDYNKFKKHLHTPRGWPCKAEYLVMIKKDFHGLNLLEEDNNNLVSAATIARVEKDHEKYSQTAKAIRWQVDLPKKDKNIPQEKIDKCKGRLKRKKTMKMKIKPNCAPVQKLECKLEIKEKKIYQTQQHIQSQHVSTPLRAPSPLPGPHPIIEMDNADEDCVPRESQEFAEQDLGFTNSVMNIKNEIALSNGHTIKSERVQNDSKDQLDKRSNYGHTIVPIKKEKKELIEVIEIGDDCDSEEDLQMQVKKELAEDKRAIDKGRAVVEEDTEDVGGAQGTNDEKLVTVRYENCLRIYCYGYLKKFLDKYKIEPHNIDKENYNIEKGIHTAIFKVSKVDAMKIMAEDIKPTKETIIKISE